MKRRTTVFSAISVGSLGALLAAGCGGGAAAVNPSNGSRRFGPLLISLTQPKSTYARGEIVSWTISVKNVGSSIVHLAIPDTCWTKFIITQDEVQVSPGYGCNTAITEDDIPPGATREYTSTWNQKDIGNNLTLPGVDTINAWFTATNINGTHISDDQAKTSLSPTPIEFTVNP